MFENRAFTVATKHGKERVIGPLMAQAFGMRFQECLIDTDVFGTFSGEIKRLDSPIDAARKKCEVAFELSGIDLVVSSEGSFGPHPRVPFLPGNEEILLLKDFKNELEIMVHSVSMETNFALYQGEEEVKQFLGRVKFPSHGLIARKSTASSDDVFKGIVDENELQEAIHYLSKNFGTYVLETDMRAHFNPTRMLHIEQLTATLIAKMKSECPNCSSPGFSIEEVLRGLPCENCGSATRSVKQHIYLCQKCNYTHKVDFPNGLKFEDPMYCDICNP